MYSTVWMDSALRLQVVWQNFWEHQDRAQFISSISFGAYAVGMRRSFKSRKAGLFLVPYRRYPIQIVLNDKRRDSHTHVKLQRKEKNAHTGTQMKVCVQAIKQSTVHPAHTWFITSQKAPKKQYNIVIVVVQHKDTCFQRPQHCH